CIRIFIDGEPGLTQIRQEQALGRGERLPDYDHWFTVGMNVGGQDCPLPTLGIAWRPIFDPVDTAVIPALPLPQRASFTTIRSWQAHQPIHWRGVKYGMKDMEFGKFLLLPKLVGVPLEIAVAGQSVPIEELRRAGWRIADAHATSRTFDDFWGY